LGTRTKNLISLGSGTTFFKILGGIALNYRLAFYLKNKPDICVIEKRLRKHLSSDLVMGKSIIEEMEDKIPTRLRTSFLYDLISENVIVKKKVSQSIEEYIFSFNMEEFNNYFSSQKQAVEILDDLENEFEKKDIDNIELVATLPSQLLFDEFPDINSIYPSIKRLIVNSKKDLWIINPFFDSFGVEYLMPSLCGAASRGVNIRIITRNFFVEEVDQRLIEALAKLVNKFDEYGLLNMLEIKHFFKRNEETGRQEYALHSKIVLSDTTSCYLGSANFTETSLKYNFELGVIIQGQKVSRVLNILKKLSEVSDIIDINKLNNKYII
jgi:hypothetical protein